MYSGKSSLLKQVRALSKLLYSSIFSIRNHFRQSPGAPGAQNIIFGNILLTAKPFIGEY